MWKTLTRTERNSTEVSAICVLFTIHYVTLHIAVAFKTYATACFNSNRQGSWEKTKTIDPIAHNFGDAQYLFGQGPKSRQQKTSVPVLDTVAWNKGRFLSMDACQRFVQSIKARLSDRCSVGWRGGRGCRCYNRFVRRRAGTCTHVEQTIGSHMKRSL